MKLRFLKTFLILIPSVIFLLTSSTSIHAATVSIAGKAKVLNTGAYLDFASYNSNVTVDSTTGVFAGYAFLEDLGWVAFGTSDNDQGPVNLNLSTGAITGKAKVLNMGNYLDFSGNNSNVTVALATGNFSGYVFSEDFGWINFADSGVTSTPFLVPAASAFIGSVDSNTAITWSWTDNSNNESGFKVEDDSNVDKSGNLSADTVSWQEIGLVANTSYQRHVRAFNAIDGGTTSNNATRVTLSTAPTLSNITADRSTFLWLKTNSFVFTNEISGGFGGSIEYLKYAWDTSPTHIWTGTETQWTSGTLSKKATTDSNSWYLHVKGYNSANVENGTLDLGPYYVDTSAPTTPGTPSTTSPTNNTSQTWNFTAATDTLSDIANYVWRTTGSIVSGGTSTTTSIVTNFAQGIYNFFVKAVDNAGNEGEESNGSVTVDTTAPIISAISSNTPASSSATLSWVTDKASSSQVEYGTTNSYGNLTSKTDLATRVLNHSVTLNNLVACSSYHYRVLSEDALTNQGVSIDKSFTTSGCVANSETIATSSEQITAAVGGTISLVNEASLGLLLSVPEEFSGSDANFQIHQLNKIAVLETTSTPVNYLAVGDYVYELKALSNTETVISTFGKPLTITMTYEADDLNNIDESTLSIYRWDGTTWHQLTECSVNTSNKTVTCNTTQFSVFTLFGKAPTNSSNDSSKDDSESNSSTSVPSCNDSKPTVAPDLFQINVTDTSAKLFFTPISNTGTFYISFSTNPNAEEHGEQVNLIREGVQSHSVYKLKPKTSYYFKVRGQNGCKTGDWSNIVMITTNSKNFSNFISFYKGQFTKVYKTLVNKVKSKQSAKSSDTGEIITKPTATSTPKPTPTSIPKKRCFLWWCF